MLLLVQDASYSEFKAIVAEVGTPIHVFYAKNGGDPTKVERACVVFEGCRFYINYPFPDLTTTVSSFTSDFPAALPGSVQGQY